MQKKPLILALLAGVALSGAAQAALIDSGGGMIYDTDLNLTWLADANYAHTSGYYLGGLMRWGEANTWAAGLVYGGYDDWRLPATLQPDASCDTQSAGVSFEYNCTGSEMGHLFYSELGGTIGQSILYSGDPDLALFQNIGSHGYWSGTEYAPSTGSAWLFNMNNGYQRTLGGNDGYFAWAVRSGDVVAVPEADTWAMLLAGLTLVGAATRRRRG